MTVAGMDGRYKGGAGGEGGGAAPICKQIYLRNLPLLIINQLLPTQLLLQEGTESEKSRSHKSKKPESQRSQEAKKPRSQTAKKPKSQEAKKPRSQKAKMPNSQASNRKKAKSSK